VRGSENISLSLDGTEQGVTLKYATFLAIQSRLRAKKSDPIIGDIETYLRELNANMASVRVDSALLYDVMMKSLDLRPKVNVIPTSTLNTTFLPRGPNVIEDKTNPCQILSPPLVSDPALFPDKSVNSDHAAIKHRIDEVRNVSIPPKVYNQYATEFIDYLIPPSRQGKGIPVERDEVIEKQNKPLQRARNSRDAHIMSPEPHNALKTFVKTEPYPGPNAPRLITSCSPPFAVELQRYVYPFTDEILKPFDWYCPGKTPVRIAEIIQELSQNGAIMTDYPKFDGHWSEWMQKHLTIPMMMKWCNEQDRPTLLKLCKSNFVNKAVSNNGVPSEPGWSTRSGSPFTGPTNTAGNCFIKYCALREMGNTMAEALKKIEHSTAKSGDDGADAFVEGLADAIVNVSVTLGFGEPDIMVVGKNEPVKFLGRVFPNPSVSLSSHQDVMRTISKIHLSSNKQVTREQAIVNKCTVYMMTDRETPLISDYCKRMLELVGEKPVLNATGEEMFKISNAWPQDDVDMIRESVCVQMGLTSSELRDKQKLIMEAESVDLIPCVIDNKSKIKIECVKEDVVEVPDGPPVIKEEKCQPKQQSKQKPQTARKNQRQNRSRPNEKVETSGNQQQKSPRSKCSRRRNPGPSKGREGGRSK